MQPLEPPEDVAHLMQEFGRIGGVVEYAFFRPSADAPATWEAHRQAILLAHERWSAEYRQRVQNSLRSLRTNPAFQTGNPSPQLLELERQCVLDAERGITADLSKLLGESVTPHQFLGRSFQTGYKPLPPGQTSGALWPILLDMREELSRLNRLVQPPSTFAKGYAYAFSNPPYGLGGDGDIRLQLFRGLNYAVLNDFAPDVALHSWTTDWCDYFQPGNEWWGSFLWTAYNPDENFVVVITASATD